MSIRYSGNVHRVTSTLSDAISDLSAGSNIQAEAIADGSVEVSGAHADIDSGSFTVTVTDDPQNFRPYRLKITERQVDPCGDKRNRLRLAQSQLEVARREGLSGRVIRGLGQAVAEAKQQLDDCVRRNASAAGRSRPIIFRSKDMYRTGNAQEDNLAIYVRALTTEDWQFLTTLGVGVSESISYLSLMGNVARDLPPDTKVDLISRVAENKIRVDFRTIRATFSVRGHIDIILAPLSGPDYNQFIGFTLSDVDLHGVVGSLGEFWVHEEEIADRAVSRAGSRFNRNLATAIANIETNLERFNLGGTLTLTIDGLIAEQSGIRVSAMIGLLLGARADPCQNLRNLFMIKEREVAVALKEGLSSQTIAGLRDDLQRTREDVSDCRARH